MRRAALALLGLFMAFSVNTAHASRILVIEATGNFYDSGGAGGWHPYHPWVSPEDYAKGSVNQKVMLDLDSCTLSKTGGSCTRLRTVQTNLDLNYNFDSGWFTPRDRVYEFSITPERFEAEVYAVYSDVPFPDDPVLAGNFGTVIGFDLGGKWDAPQFDNFSELFGKRLRMLQYVDEGFDGFYAPNSSFQVSREYPGPSFFHITETWFEYATIYVVPEPSSFALMGLAFAGLVAARRRKS